MIPRHDLTLPEMLVGDIRGVVDLWAAQTAALGSDHPDTIQTLSAKPSRV